MDMDNKENICNFCSKNFSSKVNLLLHQKSVKNCLKLQGKDINEAKIECPNCKKILGFRSFKQHKIKCDKQFEDNEKKNSYDKLINQSELIDKQNKELKIENHKIKEELKESHYLIEKMKLELTEYKTSLGIYKEQNEKLQSISTSVTMKLAEKVNTVNNINNKTVVINTSQLTNDVLRQCANTFTIDNAYNINGITNHFTSSLEEHITCTDPSRNVFKYINEKDEEIIDKDLENILPQYLGAIKDRNNFFYKEVIEYFKKNNVSPGYQTDYTVFYQALNDIIEKTGNKMSEKCKQHIVRECKRRFLEKNKNKEKQITKELTQEELMMNIIETGGNINDFIRLYFGEDYDFENETDEECKSRRDLEDNFIRKKREWINLHKNS